MRALLLLAGLLFSLNVLSQKIVFKATSSYYKKKVNNEWTDWKEEKISTKIIVVDVDAESVIIFSSPKIEYYLVKTERVFDDSDGDTNYVFSAIDEESAYCEVRLIKISKEHLHWQLYISYNDFKFMFNMINSNFIEYGR